MLRLNAAMRSLMKTGASASWQMARLVARSPARIAWWRPAERHRGPKVDLFVPSIIAVPILLKVGCGWLWSASCACSASIPE